MLRGTDKLIVPSTHRVFTKATWYDNCSVRCYFQGTQPTGGGLHAIEGLYGKEMQSLVIRRSMLHLSLPLPRCSLCLRATQAITKASRFHVAEGHLLCDVQSTLQPRGSRLIALCFNSMPLFVSMPVFFLYVLSLALCV